MRRRAAAWWRRTLTAALVLAVARASLAAPPGVAVETLPLDEAIALAREHAPRLQDARAKVALAQLDVKATRWWQWLVPSVTAQQGYDFLAGQERAAIALSLDLSKLLGKGAREAEQARLGLAQAERALEVVRAEVIIDVTKAVFDLAAKGAAVQVQEEAVAHALKLQALQTIRFEHGSTDLGPLLQTQEALARARLDLLRAQQETHLAGLALRRAIGLAIEP